MGNWDSSQSSNAAESIQEPGREVGEQVVVEIPAIAERRSS